MPQYTPQFAAHESHLRDPQGLRRGSGFAAIGAMSAEMKSAKWLWAGIGLQLAVGYSISFLVFFFGSLLTGSSLGSPWMPLIGWVMIALIAVVLTSLILRKNKEIRAETAAKA